jgi:exopolyphosphatase/pppGpp-phosphohydrolase
MKQQSNTATCAAIDIGSNSTEMAIAHCTPDHLEIIKDESTMLRIEESVKATGEIAAETRDTLLQRCVSTRIWQNRTTLILF